MMMIMMMIMMIMIMMMMVVVVAVVVVMLEEAPVTSYPLTKHNPSSQGSIDEEKYSSSVTSAPV